MKKAQHEKNVQFLLSRKGQLIGWDFKDAKNLILKANKVKSESLETRELVNGPEAECLYAFEWFKMFVENGISKGVIEKLNSRLSRVRYHHVLIHSTNGPYWRRIANADAIDDPGLGIAYCVAHLLEVGALDGLKRCKIKECENFFIGPSNRKWCSKKCGSLFRVRKTRKKKNSVSYI